MDEGGLLGRNQHGFSKGHSCLTNLLQLFESINKRKDLDHPVLCIQAQRESVWTFKKI